jgi:hypothetical protein
MCYDRQYYLGTVVIAQRGLRPQFCHIQSYLDALSFGYLMFDHVSSHILNQSIDIRRLGVQPRRRTHINRAPSIRAHCVRIEIIRLCHYCLLHQA